MDESNELLLILILYLFHFSDEIYDLIRFLLIGMGTPVEAQILAIKSMCKSLAMTPHQLTNLEDWCDSFNNYEFYKLFRMQKSSYRKLVHIIAIEDSDKLLTKKYKGGHFPIDIESKILIFIWYVATQDTLISIGTRFKICPATVMNIVNKVLFIMLKLKQKFIKFPCKEELDSITEGFKNYPGTVGALDGCHIFIKVPTNQIDSYTDRYRRQSINLMAICDSRRIFTYTFVGFPGSAHDSRVFQNSLLYRKIQRCGMDEFFQDAENFHLIADTAFPLKQWLMTPFKENRHFNRRQKIHNKHLSSDRVVIEHAFGLLKGRWRRLIFINTYSICKSIEIVLAACALHNFCLINDDLWDDLLVENSLPVAEQEDIFNDPYELMQATYKRNRIADELNRQRVQE